MTIGVDDAALCGVHGDVTGKEAEVPSLQGVKQNGLADSALVDRVSGEPFVEAMVNQPLHEAGAVESERRDPSPQIRSPDKGFGQLRQLF